MTLSEKLRHEIKSVGLCTLFFAAWFGMLVFLKWLVLTEYDIDVGNVSTVLVGALIVAKVVLVLDTLPLERWLRGHAALTYVAVRTVVYGLGVLLVLVLEKAFEIRHESGGFLPALADVGKHEDGPHVLAAAIGVTGALLVFNASFVLRRHLGGAGLAGIFLSPLREAGNEEAGSRARDHVS